VEHRQKAALSGLLSQWTTRWLGKMLAACEQDRTAVADDGPASPGNWMLAVGAATTGLRSVSCWCCQVSSDVVTPFWTVSDNPTPFAVTDQITPPDTDWLSVLLCRERTGPS